MIMISEGPLPAPLPASAQTAGRYAAVREVKNQLLTLLEHEATRRRQLTRVEIERAFGVSGPVARAAAMDSRAVGGLIIVNILPRPLAVILLDENGCRNWFYGADQRSESMPRDG